jgi:nucleotide-binding universal stress UspA family protein
MSDGALMKTPDIQLKSVLVATDFSLSSGKALRHGLNIAQYFHAKLYLFHVVSSLGLTIAGPQAIATSTTLALKDAMLLERRLVATGWLKGLRHQVIVRK